MRYSPPPHPLIESASPSGAAPSSPPHLQQYIAERIDRVVEGDVERQALQGSGGGEDLRQALWGGSKAGSVREAQVRLLGRTALKGQSGESNKSGPSSDTQCMGKDPNARLAMTAGRVASSGVTHSPPSPPRPHTHTHNASCILPLPPLPPYRHSTPPQSKTLPTCTTTCVGREASTPLTAEGTSPESAPAMPECTAEEMRSLKSDRAACQGDKGQSESRTHGSGSHLL